MADCRGAGSVSAGQLIHVEVSYALPERQSIADLWVPPGTTVAEAIERSGLLNRFPQIDLQRAALGIYSRRASLTTVLQEYDRVEIYRPLLVDPKQARRLRAAARKAAKA